MTAHHSSDLSFQKDVLESSVLTLVDFWAEWCGPCRIISPILDAVAVELQDKVKVVKLNIDENPETPGTFGVRSIPTLMLFQEGKMVSTKVGALSKEVLVDWIKSYL